MRHLKVQPRGRRLVGIDDFHRLGQAVIDSAVHAGVGVAKAAAGRQHQRRRGTAENVIVGQQQTRAGLLDLLLIEWRGRKMRIDARRPARERGHRIRVRQRNRERVQPAILALSPRRCCRDLQHDGLGRNLDRGHGDLVGRRKIPDRLHGRIAGDQIQGIGRDGGDPLHRCIAPGLVPQSNQRRRTLRRELHGARDQAVIHGTRTRNLHPIDLEPRYPGGARVLFRQPVPLHHHQRQDRNAVLFGDGDLVHLGPRRDRDECNHDHQQAGGLGYGSRCGSLHGSQVLLPITSYSFTRAARESTRPA